MSKIKLVIEIPQEVHEHAKNTSEDRTDEYSAMRAIANGIPLDDVKAEINERLWEDDAERVFEIIDKHIGGAKKWK